MVEHVFVSRSVTVIALVFAVLLVDSIAVSAQATVSAAQQDLRTRIERQYEVLPLHSGVLLKSKDGRTARVIEMSDNKIAVDGIEVTGQELRQQLGSDADLVLQLSYLEPAAQRALFGFDSPPNASARAEVPQAPPAPSQRRNRRSGALVRFGGDVIVGPDEVATDDVVVFGGTARIDGQVNGDVVAIGGRVVLGPKAYVTREVTVVGGTLDRAPGAVVDGEVTQVGIGPGPRVFDRAGSLGRFWPLTGFMPLARLAGTSLRAGALILLACIVMLLGRSPIERIGDRAVAEPLKAGLIGLLAELLLLPTLIVTVTLLAITIVGIPLLVLVPFALLLVVAVMLMGFTAVTYRVGQRAAARFGWSSITPYVSTVLGIVILIAPLLLARMAGVASGGLTFITVPLAIIGFMVEYLAWTVGFGAAALARFKPLPTSAVQNV